MVLNVLCDVSGGMRPANRGVMPRRGMPNRGGYNNMGRGNHRFNPMGGGGDMGFTLMNHI